MRVFLVGFMGAGKTSTGVALARRLGCLFVDLDRRIEAALRRDVPVIFRELGESRFRDEETRQLGACARFQRAVVATGGGTMSLAANRELISRMGISVFLDPPWEEIVRRLPGKRDERPLFSTPEQAFELYQRRVEHYRRADLRLRPESGEEVDVLAGRIILMLKERA